MSYTFASSNAFVRQFTVSPYQAGMLSPFTFVVKDLIDIAGEVTGCGNPDWAATHPKAVAHAIVVEQLLSVGATCLGKTITDELAYSLIGENDFYGTPVNPAAPTRVPGGSSSGSASAVACGLVDFAIGTDTGGSVRVPASNCGLWGYRPSHGFMSVAGVNPFAPTFDTVGVLSQQGEILKKVMRVLTGLTEVDFAKENYTLYLLEDIVAICDADIQQAMQPIFQKMQDQFSVTPITLTEICDQPIDYHWLYEVYTLLQVTEIRSCLGAWIDDVHPKFGTMIKNNFEQTVSSDRKSIQSHVVKRQWFYEKLNHFLNQKNILCFPTTPAVAPLLNSMKNIKRNQPSETNYYPRALGMNAISGLSRTPQITAPFVEVQGVPIGFSVLGGIGKDMALIELALQNNQFFLNTFGQ